MIQALTIRYSTRANLSVSLTLESFEVTPIMSFVTSSRDGRKFIDDNNFVYVFSKKSANKENSIWVCEKRGLCKGRIWTIANRVEVVRIVTPHNHAAEATRGPVLNILSRVKERARDTEETPQQILATNLQNVHRNIMAKLPRQDAIKRTIRRQRNQQGLPELPTDLEHLNIPLQYRVIEVDGLEQQFLKYDSQDTLLPDRILIFATDDNLNMLNRSDSWYGDGTFSVAPNLFFQLYTIHVEQYGTVTPAIYALLPNKTKETYQKLLQQLKNLIPGLLPTRVLLDFEAAAMGAFSEEFEGIAVSGCFFHLCQNVWRRVQSEGLQILYQGNHDFAQWVRMIPAIAFVPPHRVLEAFDELVEYENFPPEAQPIVDYFEDIYIGRRARRQRRPPIFSIEMWNMYQRTLDGRHRTNNNIEGWHRGFQSFIESLKKQQTIHAYQINQFITGAPPPRPNKRYATISARIHVIVNDYDNRNIIDYLRGISNNFAF
ncbi:hypothetical protein PPYR_02657 [Photinus pyralis]|uniref:FLYWCH-type domain-containing protein n=1 Tax=Photinus pyralis TaxID=7054 RepID=A0A5N4B7V4_PHOPY|nr:hypothetical protein PPYR_02657 [Photinus pyralis]